MFKSSRTESSLSAVQKKLNTVCVGKDIYFFNRVDSTNRVAKEYAGRQLSDGSVVVTEEQTSGRGRMKRAWLSSSGDDITCSIILYPDISADDVFSVTMVSSVAVVRAIEKVCGVSADIKWPNDVYIRGKKVSGVLVEFSQKSGRILWVVAGIGINVNMCIRLYPELRETATSLSAETGKTVSRLNLFTKLLEEFDLLYQMFLKNQADKIISEWKQRNIVLNKNVSIISPEETITGRVVDITRQGTIQLETEESVREIICGDVSLVFPADM